MKSIEEIRTILYDLTNEIKENYKAQVIGIFGSFAKGKQKKGSDLDVLVIFEQGATLFEFVGLALFLEEKLGIRKVDVVPIDTVREEIKDKILQETVYL
ncbi:nucleotidyltransferase family protein [Thermodesulfovibrio yellowstonii]|uniref:nucleotidyltransferase family protein n=1 Tax=Thermodesulfovibrio yellowstonii TaxID=28262 RepID=UPI000428131B|nr:nucleotidyltransferase family protein [Thermodesulfovibrio islandicus]